MSSSNRKLRLFVSYSRKQLVWTESLAAGIEHKHGEQIECRYDKRDLPYGQKWKLEIEEMIRWADAVVFVVSPDSIQSQWCQWELSMVADHSKRLIPIQIMGIEPKLELPSAIGEVQIISFIDQAVDEALLETLTNAALRDRDWILTHTRLAEQATAWTADGSKDRLLRGSALRHAEAWRAARPPRAPAPSKEQLGFILASQTAAKQRSRITTGLAMVFSLAMLGLALWANSQRENAQEQEAEAKKQTAIAKHQTAAASAAAKAESAAKGRAEEKTREAVEAKLAAQESATDARLRLAALLKDKAHEAWQVDKRDEALTYMVEAYGAGAQEPADRLMLGSMAASYSQAILRLPTLGLQVAHAGLSDAGDRLLVCGRDGMVRVWDVPNRKEIASFKSASGHIRNCHISSDGKRALTLNSGGEDIFVKIWNSETGRDLDQWRLETPRYVFRRGSDVVLEFDQDAVVRRNARTGARIEPGIRDEDDWPSFADVEPLSGRVVCAGSKSMKLYTPGGETKLLPAPAATPMQVFFSPKGLRMLGKAGAQWSLFDPTDGRRIAVLAGNLEAPATVHLADDRRRIALQTLEALLVFDAVTGRTLAGRTMAHGTTLVAFDASMTRALLSTAERQTLYDVASGEEVGGVDCPRCVGSSLSGDGKTIVTFPAGNLPTVWALAGSSSQGSVKAREVANQRAPLQLHEFDDATMQLRLGTAGPAGSRCELVAHEESDEAPRMRALLTCLPRSRPQAIPYIGNHMTGLPVLSADARLLALPHGTQNTPPLNQPQLYRRLSDQFEFQRPLLGLTNDTNAMAFNPAATQLLAAGGKEAVIWDLATGNVVARLTGHTAAIEAVAFDPKDRLVATAGEDKVRIWNRRTGREVASIKAPIAFNSIVFDGTKPAQLTAWAKGVDGPKRYEISLPYETRSYEELRRWADKVSPFIIVDGLAVRRGGFGASEPSPSKSDPRAASIN